MLPQWVAWRYYTRGDDVTKPPVNPANNRFALPTDPETWGTHEAAVAAVERHGLAGVGFVLTKEDAYVVVDLDKCRDPQTGQLTPEATDIIRTLNSYTEVSPSGKGVHIWVKGTKPGDACRTGTVEIYDSDRYVTVTESHLPQTPTTIEERTDSLALVYAKYVEQPSRSPLAAPELPELDDDALLERALGATNGDKLQTLLDGDLEDEYPSSSEADMALANILAFYTRDAAQVERLMRESDLLRPKWDHHPTYLSDTIKKAIEAAQAAPPQQHYSLSDMGNSERMFDRFGKWIRYVAEWDKWLVYEGGRWQFDRQNKIGQYAVEVVDAMAQEWQALKRQVDSMEDTAEQTRLRKERVEPLRKWAHKSESLPKRKTMIEGLRDIAGIQTTLANFDADSWLLNCPNGTVDLSTGELRPHDPADMLLKQCPTRYDPTAKCPQWEALLHRFMGGDEEMVGFLQRIFGYAATGETTEQVYFMFVGNGQNGKTTVLETVLRVFGEDYTAKPNASLLVQRNTEGHPTEIARLFGKRFVLMSETEQGKNLNEALVKELTGTTKLSARRMREDHWEFTPAHKLFIDSNSELTIRGQDKGIWRRTCLIHCDYTIPENEKDINFPARLLAEEAEGILAWIVEGAKAWKAEGLKTPQKVRKAVEQFREESDVLGTWLYDEFEMDSAAWESNDVIYESYKQWMEDNGHRPKNAKGLGRDLEQRGFPAEKRNHVRGRVGLRHSPIKKRLNLSPAAQADVAEAARPDLRYFRGDRRN